MRSRVWYRPGAMVLTELLGKSIQYVVHLRQSWCDATPIMHGHVHARKMRCQQHRTTRTAPLIDVAGDFFGFAHVPRASPLQPRAVYACPPPPVHSASICHLVLYTVHSFASPRTFSIVVFRKMWFGGGPIDAAGALRGFVREAGGCAVWWTGVSARSWRRTARTCTTRSGAPSASPPPRISSARSSTSPPPRAMAAADYHRCFVESSRLKLPIHNSQAILSLEKKHRSIWTTSKQVRTS